MHLICNSGQILMCLYLCMLPLRPLCSIYARIIHYQLCRNNSLIYILNYACGNQNPQDLVLLHLHTFNIKKAGITKCLFSHTSQKAQLRAPLSPLQTAWTSFDPNLYSGGSSSAGPALVEIATARSFILTRRNVTDTMSATPLEPAVESLISSY